MMEQVVKIDGLTLQYASSSLKENSKLVALAFQQNQGALAVSGLTESEKKKIKKKYGQSKKKEAVASFPMPTKLPAEHRLQAYQNQLRAAKIDASFDERKVSNDGHEVITQKLTISSCDHQQAFLLLQAMYGIPEFANYKDRRSGEVVIHENPNKSPHVWTEKFTVTYNEYDEIIGFVYENRSEGGGVFHKIHRTEVNRWVLEEVQVID